ncbi:MAG: tyrosine-type recombinase/integrase [Planctomycetota bacterium]
MSWFARYEDPATGREVDVNLTRLGLTNDEARREWLKQKSRQLAEGRQRVELGLIVPGERTSEDLEAAVEEYLEHARARLRPRTIEGYRASLEKFTDWAKRAGVHSTADLNVTRLAIFRQHFVSAKRKVPKKKGTRGTKVTTPESRKPASINHDLRAIKTFCEHVRRTGLARSLSRDDIRDSLRPMPQGRPRPEYLRHTHLRHLLEAALRHDADTFRLTRDEKSGEGEQGTTPRNEPIAPFLVFLLLSGTRLGEALSLRWRDVDLEYEGPGGDAVGEIVLTPTATKTHAERAIDLSVSPALRSMLAALKLQRPGADFVFGEEEPLSENAVKAAQKRLVGRYGAPAFSWQRLRQTTGTFLTNAQGIFGASSAYRSAKQLGNSIAIAERHYLGLERGIPPEARTLEAAMRIEDLVDKVVEGARTSKQGRSSA